MQKFDNMFLSNLSGANYTQNRIESLTRRACAPPTHTHIGAHAPTVVGAHVWPTVVGLLVDAPIVSGAHNRQSWLHTDPAHDESTGGCI